MCTVLELIAILKTSHQEIGAVVINAVGPAHYRAVVMTGDGLPVSVEALLAARHASLMNVPEFVLMEVQTPEPTPMAILMTNKYAGRDCPCGIPSTTCEYHRG